MGAHCDTGDADVSAHSRLERLRPGFERDMICEVCGNAFETPEKVARFCSRTCYRNRPKTPLIERFSEKVDLNGPLPLKNPELGQCHIWIGATDGKGYGQISVDGRPRKAHRVAWFLKHGTWPIPCCLHACDNGAIGCVRIEHLSDGTHAENM